MGDKTGLDSTAVCIINRHRKVNRHNVTVLHRKWDFLNRHQLLAIFTELLRALADLADPDVVVEIFGPN